jgi:SAM-dependent methyltransferase
MTHEYYNQQYYESRYSSFFVLEPYLKSIMIELLGNFAKRHGDAMKTLDVGCGLGNLITTFSSAGVEAIGTDISRFAAKHSKQVRASASYLPFTSESMDLVTAMHVTEHLSQRGFLLFLEEAKRILKPNGTIFVITPNLLSPLRILQRKKWLYDPTHINLLSSLSLKVILGREGFSEVVTRFRIPFRTRPGKRLRDVLLFVLTRTPFCIIRNVTHMRARKTPGQLVSRLELAPINQISLCSDEPYEYLPQNVHSRDSLLRT